MKKTFDFNKNYTKTSYAAYAESQNEQHDVNGGVHMGVHNYKEIDDIKGLMKEYKSALIDKHGSKIGLQEYKRMFLDNGAIKENESAERLYNALRYSIAYGAVGANIKNEFFSKGLSVDSTTGLQSSGINPSQAIDKVNNAISIGLPTVPKEFVMEMVKSNRNQKINFFDLNNKQLEIGNNLGRSKQIDFVKNSVDVMYTKTQRFKEVLSDLKTYNKESDFFTQLITAPIVLPTVIVAGAIKVFSGEAGVMKMNDAIDNVISSFKELKDNTVNVTKLFTLDGLAEKLVKFRAPEEKINNKLTRIMTVKKEI